MMVSIRSCFLIVLVSLSLLQQEHGVFVDGKSIADSTISGGLINLGNTCYLNSQLQCAYHIPAVRNLVLNDDVTGNDGNRGIALRSLQAVFASMENGATSMKQLEAYRGRPASTLPLCRNLGISVYEQQDSQEFWKLLLPELKLSPLVDLYQGAYEGYIAALDGSGRQRRRQETFLDLSLDVAESNSVLDSMDRMFGEPELLSQTKEGNGWRPEKGADKVDALKGSSLYVSGLPSLLQLHLMRFTYEWQTDTMKKINDRFSFPKELDLSTICTDISDNEKEHAVYDLQSVVVHKGGYGSGHYYAYVRPNVSKNKWFRFDDDRVSQVSFQEVKLDAFGGLKPSKKKSKGGFWNKLFSFDDYGYGGRDSSAYMLQYVRRSDIPKLFS